MKIKNIVIWFCLALAKPFIRKNSGDRFLIVSTTGLGDTLWGTPAIRALRQSFPNAYIGVLTSAIGKQVLRGNPHLDEIFAINEPSLFSLARLLPALIKRKIATVLVFHISQRPVLPFCRLIGASRLIGTAKINKDLDFLLTDALEPQKIHEIERRFQVVRAAGASVESKLMEMFPSDEDCQKAASLLPAGQVIGLHPGAKDKFKQWPPAHFIRLGNRLKEKFGCRIVVTGNKSEQALVEAVVNGIEGAVGICEGVSISALAALLGKLSLYITNDTGPLHIASAARTPTIALFTPTDPALCGPYFAPHVAVVQKKQTCFPCLKKKCRDPFCMLQISPDEVFETALQILERP
jgi:ADP-heptose:LPS heptosyltransferase